MAQLANLTRYKLKRKSIKKDKLWNIFASFVEEDDRNRNKVNYDLGKNITKHVKKIRNLKVKDIV